MFGHGHCSKCGLLDVQTDDRDVWRLTVVEDENNPRQLSVISGFSSRKMKRWKRSKIYNIFKHCKLLGRGWACEIPGNWTSSHIPGLGFFALMGNNEWQLLFCA